jgi:hypothetical protein
MSHNSNGPRMTMLSSSGTSGAALESSSQPQPLESGQEPAKEAAKGMLSQAEHLAGTVKDKANAAVVGVGEKMSGMAESLREHSPASLAPYTEKAAAGLEQAGSYLQRGTIGGIVDDLSDVIRRHPVPAMLTGVALGFMLARKLRR